MQTTTANLRWFFFLLTALLVSACGSGSGSGSSSDPVNSAPPATTAAPELSSLTPASLAFDLQAGESTVGSLSFANSGDAALTYELAVEAAWITVSGNSSGTLQAGASANLSLNVSCGARDLSDNLVLSSNDPDEGSMTIPVSATCAPLPLNLSIARVLMNQGARAYDSDISLVPMIELIAGREMLVRAFVTGSGQAPDARIVVSRPGQTDFTLTMQVPTSISNQPASDTTLQSSHYARVPGSAIQANSSVRIELAPFGAPITFPASGDIALDASAPEIFEVTFVPVTFEGETPNLTEATYIRDVLKVLPIGEIDVEIRTPYTYTGTFDLEDLLMEISDLRGLDGSDRLYHAIIIPPSGGSSTTAGVGFVGYPVSVSVDLGGSGFVIAHEMGHNLNLGHAPGCDAPNTDPDYPYANGAVETWGYDIVLGRLVEPTATTSDFMSYCNDLWVSDYHFNRAIEHRAQSAIGFGPPAGKGLMISGRVQNGSIEAVRMTPLERVIMRADSASVPLNYSFIAWDRRGAEIAHTEFAIQDIEDATGSAGFVVSVPAPDELIHHFEVRRDNAVVYSDTIEPGSIAPASIDWAWRDSGAVVSWNRAANQALILRDAQGRVVSVDRSGYVSLPITNGQTENMTASIVNHGLVGTPAEVQAHGHHRMTLTP